MSSVRIQLTVGSEMSLEFARLDMSKLGDTHAIVMRKELGEPPCPEATCGALVERGRWASALLPNARGVSRVNVTRSGRWWPPERSPAALALTRIHDVVRCSIVRTFLAQ